MLGIGLSIWAQLLGSAAEIAPLPINALLDIGGDPLLDIDGQELEE